MQNLQADLEREGIEVNSRWLKSEVNFAALTDSQYVDMALANWEDIRLCDIFISYQPPHAPQSSGARHTEFGLALAMGTPIIILGRRDQIYQFLPQVTHLPTFRASSIADAIIGIKRHIMRMRKPTQD